MEFKIRKKPWPLLDPEEPRYPEINVINDINEEIWKEVRKTMDKANYIYLDALNRFGLEHGDPRLTGDAQYDTEKHITIYTFRLKDKKDPLFTIIVPDLGEPFIMEVC